MPIDLSKLRMKHDLSGAQNIYLRNKTDDSMV